MTQTLLSSLRNILETALSFTCLYFFLFSLSAITPLSLLSFRAECHASLFDIFLCLLRACVFLWRLSIFPNLLGGVHLFAHTHADRCRSFARVTRFRLFFPFSLSLAAASFFPTWFIHSTRMPESYTRSRRKFLSLLISAGAPAFCSGITYRLCFFKVCPVDVGWC